MVCRMASGLPMRMWRTSSCWQGLPACGRCLWNSGDGLGGCSGVGVDADIAVGFATVCVVSLVIIFTISPLGFDVGLEESAKI